MTYLHSCFAVSQCPHLKKRYQRHVEKVKKYLESIKDFDKLVSPQSLFLHFLGPEPSTKVRKNLEVVRKSTCFCPFFFFFFTFVFALSGMTTRFSKQKLTEAQEEGQRWHR